MTEISAGGVVYAHIDNQLMIQLIQDRYGRITLAKGKMELGETTEQTALREILEETGVHGKLGPLLEKIEYQFKTDEKSIDKEVYYYLVEALDTQLHAQVEEIAGVAWFTPTDAWSKQLQFGYSNNTSVLKHALQLLEVEVS
jgi:8-oxo-dGTP pyrophosphatase MutT (NUDIX family)